MSNQQSTIVTDLDGTLLHTDMLLESMLALLTQLSVRTGISVLADERQGRTEIKDRGTSRS